MNSVETRHISLLSKKLVEMCLEYLDRQKTLRGEEFADALTAAFVASMVGAVAYRAMTDAAKAPEGFAAIKATIENATAAGVTGALTTFTGEQRDFYCTIRVVPPAVNKEPC